MLQLKKLLSCHFLLIIILTSSNILSAQFNPANGYLDAHFGKPITFTSRDSSFSLGISGRIQSLAEARFDLNNNDNNTVDFSIRRLRLNFAGSAISKRFSYRIQLCFSQRDVASDNSAVTNNLFLRDAMLFYAPNKHWRFGFGQTKLPGNRQRQTSSGNLQMVDRSNTNALFTLDRDKGLWITNTNRVGKKAILSNTLAISSGEGRITSDKSTGLCYSLRSEILPFGEFKNNGDFVEADIFREEHLKLSVGFVYSFNNKTSRVAGQLGEYLYNNQRADIHYYGADFMMKKKGWSMTGELFRRVSDNGISFNTSTPSKVIAVYSGTGFMLQTGYLVSKNNEISARYAFTKPAERVEKYFLRLNEYLLGYSHYFFRHNLKLQTDIGYLQSAAQDVIQWRFTGIVTF